MAETVGIIGTTYENRKTKKRGVLESREEKFKTLMMRDNEGKSFNITYSNFKSNWRKYQGEDVIKTSSQITEERVEAEEKAIAAKDNIATQTVPQKETSSKKKSTIKRLFDNQGKAEVASNIEAIVKGCLTEPDIGLLAKRSAKLGILVKQNGRTKFEVWPMFDKNPITHVRICMKKELWDEVVFSKKVGDVVAEYHEAWKMQFGAQIPVDALDEAVRCIIQAYIKISNKEDVDKKEDK